MRSFGRERPDGPTPTGKFLRAIALAALLSIGIFVTWMLVSDRQSQSTQARASIAEGWGGPQTLAGPELHIPFKLSVPATTNSAGQQIVRDAIAALVKQTAAIEQASAKLGINELKPDTADHQF